MPNGEFPAGLMGLGLPPSLAAALGNEVIAVVASGTTSGTAKAIPANAGTALVNAQSSQTGVLLPNINVGSIIYIIGTGAVAPVIYPPTGATINAAATSLTLSGATVACQILRSSATQFYSVPLAP
jgi:hypothetical protein